MAEWDGDALMRLRAAAFVRDGAAGAEVLAGRELRPVLQYAGDVLAAARRQGVEAESLARACEQELLARDAPGDQELVDELRGSALVEIPVDLDALGGALGGDGAFVLDLEFGDVGEWDGETGERFLVFWPVGAEGTDERQRGVARAWLAAHGYRAAARRL